MLVIILFTPVTIFSNLMLVLQVSALLIFGYFLFILIKGIIKKINGSFFSALAIVIFNFSLINDILIDNLIISSIYLVHVGFIAFIFLQSFTLSVRFANLFKTNEKLKDDLSDININLEEKVKQRTAEVVKQKEELQVQSDDLQMANEELHQQKEELKAQADSLQIAFRYPLKKVWYKY